MTAEVKLETDTSFLAISHYHWINIQVHGVRVGKARVSISGRRLIINSITIFPEFQRSGYARRVIHQLQEDFEEITADRVRNSAKGFWEKMGFDDKRDGDYVWTAPRSQQTQNATMLRR